MTVFIGTTFREFDGGENSKIQELFLDSIVNQDYQNIVLIITIFNEKTIETFIKNNYSQIKVIFVKSSLTDCRFSLTEVLLNTIKYAKNDKKSIIGWTTCDVIFQENFFSTVIKNFTSGFVCISHPQIRFDNVNNFLTNIKNKVTPKDGIDTVLFDSSVLINNSSIINKFYFRDWGIFEHFLVAIGDIFGNKMINIYNYSKISKISNDRKTNNETNEYLSNSWNKNKLIMDKFLVEVNLKNKYYDLFFCHRKFLIVGNSFYYHIQFLQFYLYRYLVLPFIKILRRLKIK
jgi:hypothetical protein